ncbi:hypothetical protein JCM9279_004994 [Rhodotorula babjevae]
MDAALTSPFYSSLSFESLLPGLFKARPHEPEAQNPRPPVGDAASSWSRSADLATGGGPPSSLTTPGAGQGMAKKRNGQRQSKHAKLKGKNTKAPSTKRQPGSTVTAPRPPPHARTSLDPAAADTEMGGPFQQAGVPLQPAPHAPKTAHRELPRVELEKLRGGDHGASAYSSAASSFHDGYYHHAGPYGEDDEAHLHPADRKHAVEQDDDEDDNLSDSFSDSPSFVYTDDDDDDASDELDDDEDDGEYDSSSGEDGVGGTKKLDESDERRPFPDPRLAKQQKYLRRTDSDGKSSSTHVDSDHAPRAEAYIESAVATPVTPRSPASPAHFLPPSYFAAQQHQPVAPSSTMAKASASHATVHYAPVSGATYDDSSAAAAGYASDLDGFDPLDGPYPRGRSKHPRLLWRSALDPGALAVLDAHHERLRGGPLPRLALELVDVRLSASGVDREREHAPGLEDEEVQERVRRARRRDAGARRRTWSQAGRQWSREMESIGL